MPPYLLIQSHPAQHVLESPVLPQRVVSRIHFDADHLIRALRVGLFEPCDGFLIVTRTQRPFFFSLSSLSRDRVEVRPGGPSLAYFAKEPALSEAEGWDSTALNPMGFRIPALLHFMPLPSQICFNTLGVREVRVVKNDMVISRSIGHGQLDIPL
jgi:hypothetical protein